MKRFGALLLVLALILTSCGVHNNDNPDSTSSNTDTVIRIDPIENIDIEYSGLNDTRLLSHIEDLVYSETVSSLNSNLFVVENVQAIYISQEYIDEVMFNTQSNIYFGYNLDELNNVFQGTRYVFTLSDTGETTVVPLEVVEDTSTEQIIKNVAIGAGVILLCVTVSYVTAGAGAPAAAMIFAASAKTGAIMALSSGALGAVSAGIVKGIETGDMQEALKAAAVAGSEGFKWGAISGAVIGGGKEAFALKAATKGGLTMNEVAIIQNESQLPLDVISEFHSLEEYQVYQSAGLKAFMVNGNTALVQNIDLNYVSELPDGTQITNLARMQRGMAPIDPESGVAYELHHVGQNPEGTLAVLTRDQHRGKGVFNVLHDIWEDSTVDHGADWDKTVKAFWKYLGNYSANGGLLP